MATIKTARARSALEYDDLLTPAEVRAAFGVCAKTVQRWAGLGLLSVARTPGGQRRYSESEVRALLSAAEPDRCRRCGYPAGSLSHRTECRPVTRAAGAR